MNNPPGPCDAGFFVKILSPLVHFSITSAFSHCAHLEHDQKIPFLLCNSWNSRRLKIISAADIKNTINVTSRKKVLHYCHVNGDGKCRAVQLIESCSRVTVNGTGEKQQRRRNATFMTAHGITPRMQAGSDAGGAKRVIRRVSGVTASHTQDALTQRQQQMWCSACLGRSSDMLAGRRDSSSDVYTTRVISLRCARVYAPVERSNSQFGIGNNGGGRAVVCRLHACDTA